MKKLLFLLLPAMFLFACNNVETTKDADDECCDKEKTEDCTHEHEGKCKNAMSVDDLMANLEENVDKEVSVCGICTHICDNSGKNIFVNSTTDEEILIIGKAADGVEAFDKALEGKNVMITGKLIAVEVENDEEIEVNHEVELDYYIEVTAVKKCCGGDHKHDGSGKHDCDGKHDHENDCDGEHQHAE
ncbi:MAG: hypothetical protein C0596_18475 [Marinilabiliales bacterium]|nr:MAG: hypothetical protein C0596_18475 [Marinilabiliales bacterium]